MQRTRPPTPEPYARTQTQDAQPAAPEDLPMGETSYAVHMRARTWGDLTRGTF